ncbi:MAG: ComEC/Rec2 family competence protein [Cetobacterium sp.]
MKKTEIGALIIIFASIFFFRLYWTTFKEKIEIGDIIELTGRVDAGRGRIENINGKYPVKNMYFTVNKVEDGEKIILGEVKKIKFSKWGVQYNIEAEEVKNKENILRNFFIKKIKKISADYSFSLEHFLRATVLGEGYLLDEDVKEKFRYTGTAHLLVISGLHIGIIITGMSLLFLKLNIQKRNRYILVFIILTLYVISIGKSPSIFRAYIMGSIYLLGNILYEKVNSKKSFILAFCCSLLIFPTWIYSISFWMSYIAVFSIIFIYEKIPKIKKYRSKYLNKVLNTLLMTLTIQLCMTPIFYIFFNTIPLFSVFSNLIIIPIASVFIMISFMTIFLSNFYLEFLTISLVNYTYIILIKSIELLSEIPYLTLEL